MGRGTAIERRVGAGSGQPEQGRLTKLSNAGRRAGLCAGEGLEMTDALPSSERRVLLGLLAGLPFMGQAGGALSAPNLPETATVFVAGPDGGRLDRWSRVVQAALTLAMPSTTTVRRNHIGGPDGVTAANQFIARGEPDGQTVLLAPGDAAIAWLVGDPRAKYDVGRWMPVMAAVTPGVVIAHPGAIAPNRDVRIAASGPGSVDLPAILGIDLLGSRSVLMPHQSQHELVDAFARGEVDAVFLRGHKVPDHAAAVMRAGGVPVFSLGARDETGDTVRCPVFPQIPTLPQAYEASRGPMPGGPLQDAWRAASAAAQLEFALVLPHLTPAASVAVWRRAAEAAASSMDVQAMAAALGVRALGGVDATATAGALAADQAALTELRRWLAIRFNWRAA